jgi:hypothetical protein
MPITAVVLLASSIVLAVFLVVMAFSFASRATRMRHEERMRMIEKGMAPPPPSIQGWPGVKQQEQQLRFEERRLLIEKGLPLPDCGPPQAKDYLRAGIITLCLGIGGGIAFILFGAFPMPEGPLVRTWLAVLSPVLALYGIGCLVYYGIAGKRAPESEPR